MANGNRFALVIGNGDYSQGRLKNPTNDAKLISETLADLDFQVETRTDLDQQSMEEAISSFSQRLPKNSFAFFFFAGHGIQAKKANYLIPVGANLNSESSLKYRSVPLDFVRDELENSKSNLNVVVLDCCRNNPFERSWNRSLGQRGFAPLPPVPEGTVIAFATGDGKVASDGQGDNSPYTRELASALSSRPAEGLSLVEGVFFTLGRTLKPKTRQHPHLYVDSTMPKYYLWKPSPKEDVESLEHAQISPIPEDDVSKHAKSEPSVKKPIGADAVAPKSTGSMPSHGHDLLAQALRYHSEGEFDFAIEAFGALINDPDVSRDVRDQARKGRGGSYLAKGTAKSINRAIIDFKAAREPGIQLSVMRSEAELRDAKTITGKVHRNEIVLLTQSKGDWLWVESVQGSRSRQGWIKCSAFLASPTASDSKAVSIVLPNKATTAANASAVSVQPKSSVVTKSEPSVQPFGTSSDPFTSPPSQRVTSSQSSTSTSPIIRLSVDGKPIGTVPSQSSQSVSIQPNQPSSIQNQPLRFDQNGNIIQSWPQGSTSRSVQSASGQPMQTYQVDQFGNPISSSRQPAATNQQSQTIYYDQNGRQIVSGSPTQTYQAQQVYKPQQQTTYQPQQQVYRTQQPTYRTQQTNRNSGFKGGFGGQIRSSFPSQNQRSKVFKSPMQMHMERRKSFGFGN